jgi:rhodanese-related sulfurtransferase
MVPGMRMFLFAAVLALGAAAGCSKSDHASPAKTEAKAEVKIPTVTVEEVGESLAKGECVPVDANGTGTRKHMGVLPGAVLLSDEETYAMSELPADKSKTLVFYCANKHCGASHEAAQRAFLAGYTHVKVMPDGIAGWVKAGKKTQQI